MFRGREATMTKKQVVAQGRKFLQVLAGARDVFLRDGYAGAGVDDIARAANVSKATLYAYFPDKRLMFQEVMKRELADLCAGAAFRGSMAAPVEETLPRILHEIATWLSSPRSQDLYRIHLAEAGRFPELAETYRAVMRTKLVAPLEEQLTQWVKRGDLTIKDVPLAARQLIAMATAPQWHIVPEKGADGPIREQSDAAACLFMRATRPGQPRAAAYQA
jgi:TetR/AcrR family transcriptional repressor of mexJK operon